MEQTVGAKGHDAVRLTRNLIEFFAQSKTARQKPLLPAAVVVRSGRAVAGRADPTRSQALSKNILKNGDAIASGAVPPNGV